MQRNYWNTILDSRIGRRRALAGTGAAAVGVALLTACGGGTKETTPSDSSGLLGKREDTTAKAKPGGVWVSPGSSVAGGADPHRTAAIAAFSSIAPVYSTLLKWGISSDGSPPASSTISGDAGESFEVSPDGMQITIKLRSNHKFDPRPPTNGRAMTAADVKWSWDRSTSVSPVFAGVIRSKNPDAPLESISAPNSQTVVIKMAFPYSSVTELLSFWYLWVLPQEAEDKFDPRNEVRGSGPYSIVRWEADKAITYNRNPDWYVKDRPFLDGMIRVPVSEYASGIAQFETGTFWSYMGAGTSEQIKQSDILRLKRDHPRTILLQNKSGNYSSPHQRTFVLSQREDSPFKDIRMRQAVSMLYDRDLFIDTFWNVSEFRKAGLPYETQYTDHLSTQALNWTDPRNKEYGPNSKYFQYNPDEAKKLVSAAGLTGTSIDFIYRNDLESWENEANVLSGMMTAGGFKLNLKTVLGTTTWLKAKEAGYEGYSGMFQNSVQGYNDDSVLTTKYSPGGKDKVSSKPIPAITDQVLKIQRELDVKSRNTMIKQVSRDLGAQMLDLPMDIDQQPYTLHWPWLKNFNLFRSGGYNHENSTGRIYTNFWYDQSEKTT